MPQLSPVTTIKRDLVFKTDSGKYWEIDKVNGTITLYANETNFNSQTPVGTMDLGEVIQVVEAANA